MGLRRRQLIGGAMAAPLTAGRAVMVPAKTTAIEIDTARAAILVVDMQNDFGAKGGMFDRAGIEISGIRNVIAPIARVLSAARSHGIRVVYLKMGFRPDLSDLGAPDAPNRVRHLAVGVGKEVRAPNGAPSRILIRDTWNTGIVPELAPKAEDAVLYKHRFSGFYETDLDTTLKRTGVRDLVVTGCTTSVCVESTVRDAMFRDYRCLVLSDCTAQPTQPGLANGNHEASLATIETEFGWVSTGTEFVRALAG